MIKGIVLGFSIAAPVGPIGVICIRRTLTSGMGNGFISGLGAARLILSGMVNVLRHKFDQKRLKWINQLSGLIIAGFGVYSLIWI